MRGCEAIRDEMKAYLDGELSPVQRASLRLHLLRCRPCREEREAMDEMATSLRAGDPDVFPPDLRARIVDNAAPELPDEPDESPALPWWRQRSLQLWSAAACVVLLWFVLMPVFAPWHDSGSFAKRIGGSGGGGGGADGYFTEAMKRKEAQVPVAGQTTSASPSDGFTRRPADLETGTTTISRLTPQEQERFSGEPAGLRSDIASGRQGDVMHGLDARFKLPTSLPSMQRHVVKAADITVEVEKLEERSESVERMVRESGGFVANNQLTTAEDGTKASSLTLKVPVDKFDATLAAIAKLGEVKAKNVTGEDITEKVSDQAQETRVIRDDLKAAEDAVTAKDKKRDFNSNAETARQLRIRLAQAEARVTELRKLSALATMTVQLREKSRTAIRGGGFLDEMGDTGRAAVNSFMLAARLPVLLLIWLAAYAPVWVPLAIAYRYAARAHKRHSAARESREWQARRAQASEGVNA